jgi:hypothetical protein
MSSNELPFYTQAALLDKYIQDIDPSRDKEIIEVIVDVLRKRKDLRQYFFRNRPSSQWANILWENGFFDSPPPPLETNEGVFSLPYWDVQGFLHEVANEAPEVVLSHNQTIESNGYYISQAIRALCRVSPNIAVMGKENIIDWVNDPNIAGGILDEVYDYIVLLFQGELFDDALDVFNELSKPRLASEFEVRGTRQSTHEPVVTLYDNLMGIEYHEVNVLGELTARMPAIISEALSEHLGNSLKLEGVLLEKPEYEKHSWWRVAVEETGQDLGNSAKDKILKRFIQALTDWANSDFSTFSQYLANLFDDSRKIIYRVGLYFLHKYPEKLPSLVDKELRKYENLDDTEIKHEHFLLLETGFVYLSVEHQDTLVKSILAGPPQSRKDKYSEYYETFPSEMDLSLTEYIEMQEILWIRDRLWMIKEYLSGDLDEKLKAIVEKFGEPKHPTFHSWMSGSGFVKNVSPISIEDLGKFSPTQLLDFVTNWEPTSKRQDFFEDESIEGLAQLVAQIIYENTNQYKEIIFEIAKTKPIFTIEILQNFAKSDDIKPKQWKILINMCNELLDDIAIRKNMESSLEGNWMWARQRIAELLRSGFQKDEHLIPDSMWVRARDILIILANDPDPFQGSDPMPELGNISAINDPLTVSLNRVRPVALRTLIKYALCRAETTPPENKIEKELKEVILDNLDNTKNASFSTYSVIGELLPELNWLDSEWVKEIITKVFPKYTNEKELWFFVSAWDSYIFHNRYIKDLHDLLFPYYISAIDHLSLGFVTRRDLINNFAVHLVLEYLSEEYEPDFMKNIQVPITRYFMKTKPEEWATGAWACWKIIQDNPDKLNEWWPKVRKLWEWRVQEAITSNHSSDFDQEMRRFVHLLEFIPEDESIITLQPLLEGMLPHIVNIKYRDRGWDELEKFLSLQVDKYPLECVQLYYFMREQREEHFIWHRENDEAIKLIEIGAENLESREETLSLIDFLGSKNNHAFRYIYDRYIQ